MEILQWLISFTGPDHHPGIRYTGRFWDDPLGEMTVPEHVGVEGEGEQTAAGRYGELLTNEHGPKRRSHILVYPESTLVPEDRVEQESFLFLHGIWPVWKAKNLLIRFSTHTSRSRDNLNWNGMI